MSEGVLRESLDDFEDETCQEIVLLALTLAVEQS